MMTIEQVREICYNVAEERGLSLMGIPIEVNGRLRSTLGRVMYEWKNPRLKTVRVSCIQFNKEHLLYSTEEAIMDTILHELAHAFIAIETGIKHGHDALFKKTCVELGTTDYKCYTKNETMTEMPIEARKEPTLVKTKPYKYGLVCAGCGAIVGKRKVQCKVTREPWDYISSCCNEALEVIEL